MVEMVDSLHLAAVAVVLLNLVMAGMVEQVGQEWQS
jgi:hypothetical protein